MSFIYFLFVSNTTGQSIECQITFYGDSETPLAAGVTMLSEMNIESVLCVVQRDSREDKLGVVNLMLSYVNMADLDPVPPQVKLRKLG